jgi:hypothetical protein
MALLFVDGFESFGSAPGSVTGLTNKWQGLGSSHTNDTIITGRFSGLALHPRVTSNTSNWTATPYFTQVADLVAGVAVRIAVESDGTWIPTTSFKEVMTFCSGTGGSTTGEVGVAVSGTGRIRVFRGDPGTSIQDSTSTGLIQPNKWYYLELKANIANSGSFDVYLDGVQVAFSSNSGDTQNSVAGATHVRLRGETGQGVAETIPIHFDDFYCLNTTGSPTDFLGPQHVKTIFPNAAGDVDDFTPSTGNNFEQVDDNGNDGDTTYVESSTTGHKDLYNFGSVGTFANINAVVDYAIAKKTDVSSFTIIPVAKSGGDESDATSLLVNDTSYLAYGGVYLTDPDTAAAWTDTAVNAAQFGYKVG